MLTQFTRYSHLRAKDRQNRWFTSRTDWLGRGTNGFTVVEMLVATAVFSMVLMVVSIGLLQISRTFYKGVTVTNTQEVARSIIDEIAASIEFSASDIQPLTPNGSTQGYCVGNIRYSFRPGQMLTDNSTSHAFVTDRLDKLTPPLGCASSVQAMNLSTPMLPANSRELLSPRMRVSKFSVTSLGNRLYKVSLRLVSGENDLLANPTLPNATCTGLLNGSQFCATVELTTVVQKRLQ